MISTVVSMPSNVFANTGTNVSVIFFDKNKQDDQVQLIDASKLGEKVKENGLQRTVLSQNDIEKIVNTAIEKQDVENFSITTCLKEIKDKGYSFSAGQYFPVRIKYVKLSQNEFEDKMQEYEKKLNKLFDEGDNLKEKIQKEMSEYYYE